MASSERVVYYKVEKTYVKISVSRDRRSKEEHVYGDLLILREPEGYHVKWQPTSGNEETWSMVDAVGFNASGETAVGGESLFTQSAYRRFGNIDFPLENLTSLKRTLRTPRQHAYIIFIQEDGTTHPPIFFQNGGTNKFISQLEKIVFIKPSHTDNTFFTVHQHEPEALTESFDRLDLFGDSNTRTHVQNFLRNPVRATLSSFAKVTKILGDNLLTEEPRPALERQISEQIMSIELPSSEVEAPTEYTLVELEWTLPEPQSAPRGPPLTRKDWKRFIDAEGRISDPQEVKQIIYRGGMTHEMRVEVWKFLLKYYPWDSTKEERIKLRNSKVNEYFAMKLQWKSMTAGQEDRFSQFFNRKALIDKDVNRTDRIVSFFSGDNNDKLQQLNDILMTYMMYNFDLGYVQGMSDLLSPILLIMDNEVDAFWCFVGYMDLVGSNFEMDQEGMKTQLSQLNMLVQIMDRKLYDYLDSQDSSNMYFAFRWLLILFKREFSIEDTMKLWEVYWTGLPCKNYQLIMATALLCRESNTIMESQFGFTEILKHINDLSMQLNVNELLSSSETLANQLLAARNLPDYIRSIIGQSEASKSDDRKLSGDN